MFELASQSFKINITENLKPIIFFFRLSTGLDRTKCFFIDKMCYVTRLRNKAVHWQLLRHSTGALGWRLFALKAILLAVSSFTELLNNSNIYL